MLLINGSNKRGPRKGGLLATRQGTILVAAGAAILAASVLFLFVSNYRDSVASKGEAARVLVASELIHQGSSGDVLAGERSFRMATVRVDQLRPGAITDPSVLERRVARKDILPGQQLVGADFAAAGGGLPDKLAGNQRAMAIEADAVHGLVGPLRAGDRVDVIAAFGTDSAGIGTPVVKKVLNDALVLRVGKGRGSQATAGGGGGSGVERGVVIRVPAKMAAHLALASDVGNVWLVARPGAGTKDAPSELVTIESVLFGTDGDAIVKRARNEGR